MCARTVTAARCWHAVVLALIETMPEHNAKHADSIANFLSKTKPLVGDSVARQLGDTLVQLWRNENTGESVKLNILLSLTLLAKVYTGTERYYH